MNDGMLSVLALIYITIFVAVVIGAYELICFLLNHISIGWMS